LQYLIPLVVRACSARDELGGGGVEECHEQQELTLPRIPALEVVDLPVETLYLGGLFMSGLVDGVRDPSR
jgi:hypothetical protein